MSARGLAAAVRSGERSARSVVDEHLETIRSGEPEIHAFNLVTADAALARADDLDRRIAAGEDPGPLAGVPVALKDNICTRGVPTTCSSRILDGWRPPYDATVVERLDAAGAVAIGSGATFTSSTANTISSVTSGTLTHTNSKNNAAVFSLSNIKPGDVVNGSLTITNTGSLPASFSLTETSSTNGFADNALSLTITNTTTGTKVYDGNFGGLTDGQKNPLGTVDPGVASSYTFSVRLADTADNTQQGKTASAAYSWDSTQLAATTTNQ